MSRAGPRQGAAPEVNACQAVALSGDRAGGRHPRGHQPPSGRGNKAPWTPAKPAQHNVTQRGPGLTFIETVAEDEATGATAEMYAADRQALGFLPNFTQAFSLRPEVYGAWKQLNGAIKSGMDLRRYELATLGRGRAGYAGASAIRSMPLSTAWMTRGRVTRLRSNSSGV